MNYPTPKNIDLIVPVKYLSVPNTHFSIKINVPKTREPLIMVFIGPRGTGKSEISARLKQAIIDQGNKTGKYPPHIYVSGKGFTDSHGNLM